jgi:hypothetical protein
MALLSKREKPEFCCGFLDVLLKDEGDGGER